MKQIRRKYRKMRVKFKKELLKEIKQNQTLAMLIVETYTAWQHKRHIMKIWSMLINPDFKNFRKAYYEQLFGQHLTGDHSIWRSFYFAGYQNLYEYQSQIPEKMAMGDALGIAFKIIKKSQKSKNIY